MAPNIRASALIDFAVNIAKLQTDMNSAVRIVDTNFKKINKSASELRTAFATIAGGIAVKEILRTADQYNVLQARIKQATKATGDYAAVSRELFRISQQTGASLKDTTDVFQRLSLAATNLGSSNKDLLQLTATVEKLGVLGGASTSALNAGLMQFGQAMGSGIVRAEEFNSLIENIPLVAKKIADGMGMTTAQLRTLVIDGKILSKDVFESLKKQAPEIAREFEKMPASLERSANALANSFQKALGELDNSIGLTRTLAAGLDVIAQNADKVTGAVTGIAVAIGIVKIATLDYVAMAKAATAAWAAMSGPIGIAALAIGAAVAAVIAFKDESFQIGKYTVSLGTLWQATWEAMSEVAASAWKAVSEGANKAWQFIVNVFNNINEHGNEKMQGVTEFWARSWQIICNLVTGAWNVIVSVFNQLDEHGNKKMKGVEDFWVKSFTVIGRTIRAIMDGAVVVIKGFLDAMARIPFIGDKFKGLSAQVQEGYDQMTKGAAKTLAGLGEAAGTAVKGVTDTVGGIAKGIGDAAKTAGDQFNKFANGILTRASELEAAKKKAAEVSDTKTPAIPPIDKTLEKAKEFLEHQRAINAEMATEVKYGEAAAEFEKLKAQFAEKVKRDLLPGELKALKEILAERKKIRELDALQKANRSIDEELQALAMKRQGLEDEIPVMQFLNELKAKGLSIAQQEVEALKEKYRMKGLEERSQQTDADIEAMARKTQELRDQLRYGKDESEVLAAQRDARSKNKDITQEQLDAIRRMKENEIQINHVLEAREKWMERLKKIQEDNMDSFLDLISDGGMKNELKAIADAMKDLKPGEALTEWQEQQLRAGAAMKTYLEDAKKAQDIIKDSRTDQQKWNDELKELNRLAQQGLLTFDQWSQAVKKASPEYKKIKEFSEETAKTFTKALDDWIFKGKKLSEVFKDLTKNLAATIAKKALFEPLENKITNSLSNALWNRKAPAFPGTGTFVPNPYMGGLPFNFAGGNGPFGMSPFGPGGPGGGSYTGPPLFGGGSGGSGYYPGFSAPMGGLGPMNITASGPVTVNSGSMNIGGGSAGNNPITSAFDKLKQMLGGLFGGFLGGLKNIISLPFNMLGGLFGGGGGGGMLGGLGGMLSGLGGGLGGISKIGGLLNPLGLLGGIGNAFNTTMGGDNIFKSIAPLLNPLGLLGGIGKAAGTTLGGDSIFRDVAPLMNPLNLFKGITSAVGGVFGGGKYFGGGVTGGMSYLVGERGPELFTPGSSGQITPNRQLDIDGIMQKPGGNPYYQGIQNYKPDWSQFNDMSFAGQDGQQGWRIEQLLAKKEAYMAMTPDQQMLARTTGAGYFNSQDNYELERALHTVPLTIQNQLAELERQQLYAGTQAILETGATDNFTRGWATSTQANHTWAAISRALPGSLRNFSFALGDQNANMLQRWAHRGAAPGAGLMSYANALDYVRNKYQPAGGWQAFGMGYSSMGMGGGGGFAGQGWYENDKQGRNAWGTDGSGFFSRAPVAGWGDGWGYRAGAHAPRPFENNSLLKGGWSTQTVNDFQYDKNRLYNKASWEGNAFGRPGWEPWNVLPDVYGSSRNASSSPNEPGAGGWSGYGLSGTEHTLRNMMQKGYTPEIGRQLGTWSNNLRAGSAYQGFYQPQETWLKNTGTMPGTSGGHPINPVSPDSSRRFFATDPAAFPVGQENPALAAWNKMYSDVSTSAAQKFAEAKAWMSNPQNLQGLWDTYQMIDIGPLTGPVTSYATDKWSQFQKSDIYRFGMRALDGYAHGGRPKPGEPAVVGEFGPELFVPDTSGAIIPNRKMKGGSDVNVFVEVKGAHDNYSVNQRRLPNGDMEIVIQDMLASAARNKGGSFSRALNSPRSTGRS